MKRLFLLLLLTSCGTGVITPPGTDPVDPVVTIPEEKPKLMALDSFTHPDQAPQSAWKTSLTRTIFSDQETGYVVKGDLCLLAGKAQKILPINIDKRSAVEYKTGIYYDALIPLTVENCTEAKYAWIDLRDSFNQNGLSITISKIGPAGEPFVPLAIQLEPFAFGMYLNNNVFQNDLYNWALPAQQMLREHRILPYKSYVTDYDVNPAYPFEKFNPKTMHMQVPINAKDSNNQKMNTALKDYKPWFYVVDEPGDADLLALKTKFAKLKTLAPDVARMVTTIYKKEYKDLIDIFCPVMEHADLVARENYSRLCLYTSCMAGGCDVNRLWIYKRDDKGNILYDSKGRPVVDLNNFTHTDYNWSGSPDLVIDAPLNNSFGFFMVGLKYDVEFLLYYNSIEQWSLMPEGLNPFVDQYNFGGNGDGTLLYPDIEKHGAFPSLRLKMLREASYMINAAVQNGKTDLLKSKVQSALKWSFDDSLRDEVFKK